MTREEFIKILNKEGYDHREEKGKIVISYLNKSNVSWNFPTLPSGIVFENKGDVYLRQLDSLPSDVIFKNGGSVYLYSVTDLSPDVEFKNGKNVYFGSLKSIPLGVKFENKEELDFRSISTIPPGVILDNGGIVYLECLIKWPSNIADWLGNIEGIESKRTLNKMISDGVFDIN